ncbi:MAG TPA: hypothetical protein VNJ28_06455, partial [Candidatus Limnocylindrales bacterium]|nr:hypothetical protein [Candidatus Limnocylindrales bacterium]
MRVPRPKGWLLLPLAGLALLAVLGPTLLSGAGSEPIVPGPCPADRAAAPPAGRVPGTWYRLDPVLDANGSLTGQRLEAGSYARRASFTLDLPPDAFAGGPFGEVVLFGTDDGTTSRLATLDLAAGCTVELVATSELVWRATIDPAGVTLYEQRLDRAGRSDAGVWRRSLADPTTAERVLEPAGAGPDEEPPFSIELVWSLAGD